MRPFLAPLFATFLVSLTLTACGTKGPLFIPQPATTATATPAAPTPAPAADDSSRSNGAKP